MRYEVEVTLPAIIVVAVVTQIPIIFTLFNSLIRWIVVRPDLPREFVGIKHYAELVTSSEFWIVFKNTIVLTAFSLAFCFLLGIFLALLIYRRFPGVGAVRTLLIAPFFISDAVIGVYWRNVMLGATYGLLPVFFRRLEMQFPDLLAQFPLILIIVLIVWKWTPFFMLILTAGLQSIPEEVIEASIVDGANGWIRTVNVILPQLKTHMNISLMLGLIFVLKTFGLIFTATHGGPGYASTNFPYYVYRTALLGWNVGKGAAIAVLVVIISLATIMILFRFLRRSIGE